MGNPASSVSPILTAAKTLTAAEIAGLGAGPVTIVPAITGRTLIPLGAVFAYTFGTVPFANAGDPRILVGGGAVLDGTSGFNDEESFTSTFAQAGTNVLASTDITIDSDGSVGGIGPIAASALDDGGELWIPGDTANIGDPLDHTPDGVITVSTVTNSFVVNQVNQGANTVRLTGDATAFQVGDTLALYRSTGNDGEYEITNVGAFAGGNTLITLDAGLPLPSAVADGRAGDQTLGLVGVIATYALTNPGGQYHVGGYSLEAIAPSIGEQAEIVVSAVTSLSDGTGVVTVYYAIV